MLDWVGRMLDCYTNVYSHIEIKKNNNRFLLSLLKHLKDSVMSSLNELHY